MKKNKIPKDVYIPFRGSKEILDFLNKEAKRQRINRSKLLRNVVYFYRKELAKFMEKINPEEGD